MKPRAADLFCCAGGASMGLHRAGFDVEGWDIKPQKRYPFIFHLGDALEADLSGFDFVWASPPCQRYTRAQNAAKNADAHPDLVQAVRAEGRAAMGIDWMTRGELSEAIPPAYSEYLGRQILTQLTLK